MPVENPHNCPACGFDGGLAHAKEIESYKEQIRRNKEPASGSAKLTFAGFVFLVSVIAGSISWHTYTAPPEVYHEPPPPAPITNVTKVEHPVAAVYANLNNMYDSCLKGASSDLARSNCNITFENSQKEVVSYLKSAYPSPAAIPVEEAK